MGIAFVIPFKTDKAERERNFKWLLATLGAYYGDDDSNKMYIPHCDQATEFNRSTARNLGVEIALAQGAFDYIVVLDADTIFNKETLDAGLALLDKGAPWVISYTDYYAFNSTSTDELLDRADGGPGLHLHYDNYGYDVEQPNTGAVGGLLAFRPDDIMRVGGWDERFVGWGWEDRAFAHAADQILGPHQRPSGAIYHLWHPAPIEQTIHHPKYQENWSLYNEYIRNFKNTHQGHLIK